MADRFTLDGSDELEKFLSDHCAEIAQEVAKIVPSSALQALVLCGGYGRGEGGVLRTEEGDRPYNDLEFFLLIRGAPRWNERRYSAAIHQLEKTMTEKVGIDVELKISSVESIARGATTMFSYDLVMGHRVLLGRADILQTCEHHADAAKIPLHEVTRLLMNRCSGLLFAKSRLESAPFSSGDADFVLRNIRKAQLALGDAMLAMEGRYHWSCTQRHQELEQQGHLLVPAGDLIEHHQQGVAFKLHPEQARMTREELGALHEKVSNLAWSVFARVEVKRLRQPFSHPLMYVSKVNKCPETNRWKNALIRLRYFGWSGWKHGGAMRYPREALLHSLVLLLWQPMNENMEIISEQLVCSVNDWQQAVAVYQQRWNRFN